MWWRVVNDAQSVLCDLVTSIHVLMEGGDYPQHCSAAVLLKGQSTQTIEQIKTSFKCVKYTTTSFIFMEVCLYCFDLISVCVFSDLYYDSCREKKKKKSNPVHRSFLLFVNRSTCVFLMTEPNYCTKYLTINIKNAVYQAKKI